MSFKELAGAKGLSGWSRCQDRRLPEEMPAGLRMPSLQWGIGAAVSRAAGSRLPETLCPQCSSL